MAWARTSYCGVSWLIVGGLVLQFFVAGLALFADASFDAHAAFGYFLGIASVALLALAHYGCWLIRDTAILVGLVVLQAALVWFDALAPWLAALHPVNALVLVWWTYGLARRSREIRATFPHVATEPY